MKKKLNEDIIKNELKGSAFFPKDDITQPSNDDTMPPRSHDTTIPRYHPLGGYQDDMLENIRKALRSFGKEAATHRFTLAEKQAIAELIYRYKKDGIRTNENEIARIAINFIINDHKEFGKDSILDLVLKRLNE